jgi:hypothetical protein
MESDQRKEMVIKLSVTPNWFYPFGCSGAGDWSLKNPEGFYAG